MDIRLEKDSEFAVIRIRDYGIGIPKDKIKHIFERFFRIEQGRQIKRVV